MLEVPPDLLAERRRCGADRWDEMWDGVLHMVPPPSSQHQFLGSELLEVLGPLARAQGLRCTYETGAFRPATELDYRVPDLAISRAGQRSARGVEGAPVIVIELRSPNDETDAKIEWYASQGAVEIWAIDPATKAVDLWRCADGRAVASAPAPDGTLRSELLGVDLRAADGLLHLSWSGGSAALSG